MASKLVVRSLVELERLSNSGDDELRGLSALSIQLPLEGDWNNLDPRQYNILCHAIDGVVETRHQATEEQYARCTSWCNRVRDCVAHILSHTTSLSFLEYIVPDFMIPFDIFPKNIVLEQIAMFSLQWRITIASDWRSAASHVRTHGPFQIDPYSIAFSASLKCFLSRMPSVTTLRLSLAGPPSSSLPPRYAPLSEAIQDILIDVSILPSLQILDLTKNWITFEPLFLKILPAHKDLRHLILDGVRNYKRQLAHDVLGCEGWSSDEDSEHETPGGTSSGTKQSSKWDFLRVPDWQSLGHFLWDNKSITLLSISIARVLGSGTSEFVRLRIKHGAFAAAHGVSDFERVYVADDDPEFMAFDEMDVGVCSVVPGYPDTEMLQTDPASVTTWMESHAPQCAHVLAYGTGPFPEDIWSEWIGAGSSRRRAKRLPPAKPQHKYDDGWWSILGLPISPFWLR